MTKLSVLRIVNAVLLVSFILQVATSLMLFFEFFPFSGRVIAETHEYNGLFFIFLVFLHIGLNWNWIKANFLARLRQ